MLPKLAVLVLSSLLLCGPVLAQETAVCGVSDLTLRNFMNYSDDLCMEHFTPGQIERTILMTGTFRPTLVPW